jgi:hypothetical protein
MVEWQNGLTAHVLAAIGIACPCLSATSVEGDKLTFNCTVSFISWIEVELHSLIVSTGATASSSINVVPVLFPTDVSLIVANSIKALGHCLFVDAAVNVFQPLKHQRVTKPKKDTQVGEET